MSNVALNKDLLRANELSYIIFFYFVYLVHYFCKYGQCYLRCQSQFV